MQVMEDNLFTSLFEIVTFFNRPKQDKVLLRAAGISLDSALFPLVMRIGIHGSLGIVELADQVGRDHSTVSRQVDKLTALNIVTNAETADKRVRQVTLTKSGKTVVRKITVTRRKLMKEALQDWSEPHRDELQHSLAKLAQTLRDYSER
jgi:DNA-binding MarR family transcriptional regulator